MGSTGSEFKSSFKTSFKTSCFKTSCFKTSCFVVYSAQLTSLCLILHHASDSN